jgi:hypothetical protein
MVKGVRLREREIRRMIISCLIPKKAEFTNHIGTWPANTRK